MKWFFMIVVFALIACSGFAGKKKSHTEKDAAAKKMSGSYTPVAVLELFTSEGCSSCPSADNLLPQLAKLDSNIIPLSFHVDYWNRLGWTDPFSNSDFTERQKQYSDQFHLESVYTPQLVVNGEYELVGSNRNSATTAIQKALAEKPAVIIHIDDVKSEKDKLLVSCHIDGDLKKVKLLAALVQEQAVMNVKAGENNGARLTHTNVVRTFIQTDARQNMNFELARPKDLTDGNLSAAEQGWTVILYTQRKEDLKITGATEYKNIQ
jgi:hypothetical protein